MTIYQKKIWIFPLLILLCHLLSAKNFSKIDSVSVHTPSEVITSLDALVTYCHTYASTNVERVRFYFVWIATHIQYDELGTSNDKQTPESVFNTKKAICSGYTRLLSFLCEQSNMPARYVAGYGKEPTDEANIQNHAWNVIRIDGQWHPFDVTWAADELTDDQQNLLPPAFELWFMPHPEAFQTTHLPFDPAYQLTNQLMSRRDFFKNKERYAPNPLSNSLSSSKLTVFDGDFTTVLNEETALDSLERTWRSFRRGYNFMPMDSAVAIKLAKIQDAKVKRTFDFIQQFSENDYPNIRQSTTATLKRGLSQLQQWEKPIEDALVYLAELKTLPLSADNKQMVMQNHSYYQNLVDFTQKAVRELNEELGSRDVEGRKMP